MATNPEHDPWAGMWDFLEEESTESKVPEKAHRTPTPDTSENLNIQTEEGELPSKYEGLPVEIIKDLWTIPMYADPEETRKANENKQRILSRLREKEETSLKLSEVREQLGLAPTEINIPTPVLTPEIVHATESIIVSTENIDTELQAFKVKMDQFLKDFDRKTEKTVLEELPSLISDYEASNKGVVTLLESLKDNGKMTPYAETMAQTISTNHNDLLQFADGRHFYNNEVKAAIVKILSSSKSILNEYKKLNP